MSIEFNKNLNNTSNIEKTTNFNPEAEPSQNVEQLKNFLAEKGEFLNTYRRLELLGKVYGLEPSNENKQALAKSIKGIVNEKKEHAMMGNYDIARDAVIKTIEFSKDTPDLEDIIESIKPAPEYLSTISKDYANTLKSLHGHARGFALVKLAEKSVSVEISQGNPDAAKATLLAWGQRLKAKKEEYLYDLHYTDVMRFENSIVELYAEKGQIEEARAYVGSDGFTASKVEPYLYIYKVGKDEEDLKKARSATVYDSLYYETQKWSKIAETSGQEEDSKELMTVLEKMINKDNYPPKDVFHTYKGYQDSVGVDKQRLIELMKEKVKSMNSLDRAAGYITIAEISKNPEDEAVIREEILKVFNIEGQFKIDPKTKNGFKSKMLNESFYDAATAYGKLLEEYINYLTADKSRLGVKENKDVVHKLLERYQYTFRPANGIDNHPSSAVYQFRGGGALSAKVMVEALFKDNDSFKENLGRKNDMKEVRNEGLVRLSFYGGDDFKIEDQNALETLIATYKEKSSDKQNFMNNFNDFMWRFLERAKTENDYKFAQYLIYVYGGVEDGLYQQNQDIINKELARLTAYSNPKEAQKNITKIKDINMKGFAIAEVAKVRRDIEV